MHRFTHSDLGDRCVRIAVVDVACRSEFRPHHIGEGLLVLRVQPADQ